MAQVAAPRAARRSPGSEWRGIMPNWKRNPTRRSTGKCCRRGCSRASGRCSSLACCWCSPVGYCPARLPEQLAGCFRCWESPRSRLQPWRQNGPFGALRRATARIVSEAARGARVADEATPRRTDGARQAASQRRHAHGPAESGRSRIGRLGRTVAARGQAANRPSSNCRWCAAKPNKRRTNFVRRIKDGKRARRRASAEKCFAEATPRIQPAAGRSGRSEPTACRSAAAARAHRARTDGAHRADRTAFHRIRSSAAR